MDIKSYSGSFKIEWAPLSKMNPNFHLRWLLIDASVELQAKRCEDAAGSIKSYSTLIKRGEVKKKKKHKTHKIQLKRKIIKKNSKL